MSAAAIALFALVVVAYALTAGRLARANISAPMVFAIAGAMIAWGRVPGLDDPELILTVAEATLAIILFQDAAQVRPSELVRDRGPLLRLLLIGLPLTIAAGWALSYTVLGGAGVWVALFIAAALAPTDAGLGAATVLNPVVPARVRRILNGESGLNDGLATPVVLFALAAIAGGSPEHVLGEALLEIVIAAVVGIAVGFGAGRLVRLAEARQWTDHAVVPLGVLALPLLAYFAATAVHGNGFIAAFLAGTAFASVRGTHDHHALSAAESVSALLSSAVWFIFGALFVSRIIEFVSWESVVIAVCALTILRIGPVVLVLLGTGLSLRTALFIGWFGPCGLATVVFSLIAIAELGSSVIDPRVAGALGISVFLSVIAHGITASPWSRAYGAWAVRTQAKAELSG